MFRDLSENESPWIVLGMGQVRLSYANCLFHDISILWVVVIFVNILDMEGMSLSWFLKPMNICLYVVRYVYCVIMWEPINVQSVTMGKVRVIHWTRRAHDLTIFQVLETRRDHRSIKRTYLDLEGSLYVYVMDYV